MDAIQIDADAFWLRLFEALLIPLIVDDVINIGSNKYSDCMGAGVANLIIGLPGAMGC
jgi:hypothetical protein